MGQSILDLVLGHSLGNFVLDGFPHFGHSHGLVRQSTDHQIVDAFIRFGVLCLLGFALSDFLIQFGQDILVRETVTNQSILDSDQRNLFVVIIPWFR